MYQNVLFHLYAQREIEYNSNLVHNILGGATEVFTAASAAPRNDEKPAKPVRIIHEASGKNRFW